VSFGKRFARIIRSNLNDLLSHAEDPEKQMDLALSDMQDALRQGKQVLIGALAEEKRLQRELDQADELTRLWEGKAQQAVAAGRDDLAREALRKKRTYADLATELDTRLADQQKAVDDLRAQYKLIERRIAEAQDRRRAVTAERVRRSRDRQADAPPSAVASGLIKDRSSFDKFEEMAEKVERFETETDARRELDTLLDSDDRLAREIDSLGGGRGTARGKEEHDLNVEIELEDLRKRAGERPAPPPEAAREPEPPADAGPPERRSRRREPEPASGAPEPAPAPDKPAPPAGQGDDEGDGNWGRRVEL